MRIAASFAAGLADNFIIPPNTTQNHRRHYSDKRRQRAGILLHVQQHADRLSARRKCVSPDRHSVFSSGQGDVAQPSGLMRERFRGSKRWMILASALSAAPCVVQAQTW